MTLYRSSCTLDRWCIHNRHFIHSTTIPVALDDEARSQGVGSAAVGLQPSQGATGCAAGLRVRGCLDSACAAPAATMRTHVCPGRCGHQFYSCCGRCHRPANPGVRHRSGLSLCEAKHCPVCLNTARSLLCRYEVPYSWVLGVSLAAGAAGTSRLALYIMFLYRHPPPSRVRRIRVWAGPPLPARS